MRRDRASVQVLSHHSKSLEGARMNAADKKRLLRDMLYARRFEERSHRYIILRWQIT